MHFLLAVASGLTLYTVASLVPATLLDVAAFGSANELAASLEAGSSFGVVAQQPFALVFFGVSSLCVLLQQICV